MKILVVDDSSTMRRIIVNALQEINQGEVVEAADGKEALKCFGQHEDIGLILTDWNMPTMSGVDLLVRIREDGEHRDMPVVMVTAEASRETVAEAAARAPGAPATAAVCWAAR